MIVTVKTPSKPGTVFEQISPGDVFGIPNEDRFVAMKVSGPGIAANAIVLRRAATSIAIPAFDWTSFAPSALVVPYGAELVVHP